MLEVATLKENQKDMGKSFALYCFPSGLKNREQRETVVKAVVACTCDPAALEAEFGNSQVGGLCGGWTSNPAKGENPD